MENQKPRVGIFWDIDNVTIPSHFTALETINAIEAYASTFGEVKLSNIKVYYDPSERLHQKHTKDFFNKNINLTVICKDKPQIGDMAMISDMWSFAYDNKGQSIVIVIVTGDSDFARVITQMEQKDGIHIRLILPNQNVDKSLEIIHAKRLSWILETYVPKKPKLIETSPLKLIQTTKHEKHDRQFHDAKSSPLKWKSKYRGLRISTNGKSVTKSRGEDGIAILGSIWKNKEMKYTCKLKISEKKKENEDMSPGKPKNLFWLGVIDKNALDPQHRGSLMDYNSKCWAVNSAIDKLNDGGQLKKIGRKNNCAAKDGSVIEMTLENGVLKFKVDGVDAIEMKGIGVPVVPAVSLARRHVEVEVVECN